MLARLTHLLAEIATPDSCIAWRWELKSRLLRRLGVDIGKGVAVDNGFFFLSGQGIHLMDHVVIGKNVKVYNFSDVVIGKFCMFAGEVLIANGGHDKDTFEPFSGPVSIGNGCWIGTGAQIVGANLTIGDNAIVGAGALVNADVPAGAIVAGVPARVIGYRTLPPKVWHLGNTWYCPHTFQTID